MVEKGNFVQLVKDLTNQHLNPNPTFAVRAVPILHKIASGHGNHSVTAIQAN